MESACVNFFLFFTVTMSHAVWELQCICSRHDKKKNKKTTDLKLFQVRGRIPFCMVSVRHGVVYGLPRLARFQGGLKGESAVGNCAIRRPPERVAPLKVIQTPVPDSLVTAGNK